MGESYPNNIVEKGQMFNMSDGEYSDYCFGMIAVANERLDFPKMAREYLAENPGQTGVYAFCHINFYGWVSANFDITEVDCQEIWTGAYGTLAESLGGSA